MNLTEPRVAPRLLHVLANAAVLVGLLGGVALPGFFVVYNVGLATVIALTVFGIGLAVHCLSRGGGLLADGVIVVLETGSVLFAVVDTKVYALTCVHIYSSIVTQALLSTGGSYELALGRATLGSFALFAFAVLAVQATSLALLARLALRFPLGVGRLARAAGVAAIGAVGLSVATAPTLRLRCHDSFGRFDALVFESLVFGETHFVPNWSNVTYPLPSTPSPRLKRPKSILFIVVESFRADALGAALTPNLWALRQRCLTSAHHYSGGHTTEFGMFSALYGLQSYYYVPFSEAKTTAFPLSVLRANGYRLRGSTATPLRDWNGAGFMLEAFDSFDERTTTGSWRDDRAVAEDAVRFGKQRDPARPFFQLLFFHATHHNYYYPPEFALHTPAMPVDYDHFMGDDRLAEFRIQIENRYKNSVTYVDSLIAQVLRAYAPELERGELAVVVTGDHGEEFWDHGFLGHGAPLFYNERIQVPLLLYLPGVDAREVSLSSHVDLWPTLLDALGAELSSASFSDGVSLLAEPPAARTVLVGGTGFPVRGDHACLIEGSRKVWVNLCPGDEFCLQKTKASDLVDHPVEMTPGEATAMIRRFERNFSRFTPPARP
ncbi:MAG: sulfatase [Candidatus Riflebacteria bacterium]|nr:sulfatase [Candidatus Riflebacteria bacterium]